jgi:predicted NUDIX family phosphoesterase
VSELVLAVNRQQLTQQGVGTKGIYPIDLTLLDQKEYALLPRESSDNKSVQAITLGMIFPQILGYFQVIRPDGRILCYQRKGKEKGLLGKWSLGVGGHVSQEDFLDAIETYLVDYPSLQDIICLGSEREIEEELNLSLTKVLGKNLNEHFKRIISLDTDATSSVHVGLPVDLHITESQLDKLKLDPSEFLNYQWLTSEEIKHGTHDWEPWSKLLIETM